MQEGVTIQWCLEQALSIFCHMCHSSGHRDLIADYDLRAALYVVCAEKCVTLIENDQRKKA